MGLDITPEHEGPKSKLERGIATAETESDLENQALLTTMVIHEFFLNDGGWGLSARKFVSPIDGKLSVQAGVGGYDGDFTSVRELTEEQSAKEFIYHPDNKELIRLGQTRMVQIPNEKNPIIFLTMSSCTALIGHTEADIFVAHVGLSERGGLQKFVNSMREKGVKTKNMYSVASIAGADAEKGVKTENFDYSRIESADEITALDIPQKNIRSFEDNSKSLMGVMVTPQYVGSYSFEYNVQNGKKTIGNVEEFEMMSILD